MCLEGNSDSSSDIVVPILQHSGHSKSMHFERPSSIQQINRASITTRRMQSGNNMTIMQEKGHCNGTTECILMTNNCSKRKMDNTNRVRNRFQCENNRKRRKFEQNCHSVNENSNNNKKCNNNSMLGKHFTKSNPNGNKSILQKNNETRTKYTSFFVNASNHNNNDNNNNNNEKNLNTNLSNKITTRQQHHQQQQQLFEHGSKQNDSFSPQKTINTLTRYSFQNIILITFVTFLTNISGINSAADANRTTITTPASGFPLDTTILSSTNSTFEITSLDSTGTAADGIYFAELYSYDSCEIGYASSSCQVLCYPYNSPHTANAQCISYTSSSRYTKTSETALWVIADVTDLGSSIYEITYDDKIEVSTYYDVNVYLLTNGGLKGRYWDNIWMVDNAVKTQIDSEINFNWGTSAITTYGTDYVSIRWEGKIKPPYNETYTFYIYADDGARIWIDKRLIADSWDKCCNETWGSVDLSSVAYHDIIVEYREIRGESFIELRWSSASIAKTIVPSTYLYYQEHISGSPFSYINVGVGEVSYTLTTVTDTSPFLSNTAGVNNSVYVTAKDAFGHVIDSDTANFTLTDLDGMTSIATWIGNGIYEITFQSNSKTSNTTFNIKVGEPAIDILGSPYWVVVSPADTSPENATLAGNGLEIATAGEQATFNITVYDEFMNERESGTDTITVRFTGADAGKGTCSYSNNNDGVYYCEYTLTTVGLYTPIVLINGESAGRPTTLPYVNVTAGDIHGPSCTMTNNNGSMIAGEFEYVVIQARDQFGNAIGLTTANFNVAVVYLASDSNTTISTTVTSNGFGEYNATFTPLLKGDYQVSVKLSGSHIEGSPYSLTVSPGAVDASLSYIIDSTYSNHTGGASSAISNEEAVFEIQTVDSQNNTLESDASTFSTSEIVCDSVTVSVNCTYQSDGKYRCKYTPTKSDSSCVLTIEIGGIDIDGSPFTVDVEPGTIDADTTYVYDITDGVAGISESFMIQAKDTNENNLTSGGHTFYVTLIDLQGIADDVTGSVVDNSDGSYTASYYTTIANRYESIRVELFEMGGLKGNYYTDYEFTNVFNVIGENIIDETIEFDWGTGIPLDSTFGVSDYFSIEWNGYLYPPYSETYTIYTPIYGNSGVRLYIDNTLVIDNFDPSLGDSDPFVLIQLTKNTYYQLKLQFREQTGNSKINLEWNSPSINGREIIPSTYLYYRKEIDNTSYVGNVSIIPSDTYAKKCTATGDGLTTAIAGATTSIEITAKDKFGNIQTDAGNEELLFNLTLKNINDDSIIVGTITDSGNSGSDGLYTGIYNVTDTSSQYIIYVAYNNIVFKRSIITVTPGSISSTVSSANITDGRAGEIQTFMLFLRDDYGNLCQCGGSDNSIDLIVNFTHEDGVTSVLATSMIEMDGGSGDGQGIFTITYNLTKNGYYTAVIVADGVFMNGLDTFNISNAIADYEYTFIQGWESGAVTDIVSGTPTIQYIQLQDVYQNNITATGGYEFYVTLANGSENDTQYDRGMIRALANGLYELNYTAAFAGDWVLTVQLASGDIDTPDGLTGAYYNNRWLYGDPILTQIDANVSQSWGTGLVTTTAKDYVSIQWTGFIKPLYAETYNFTIISDDGARLYIDGMLVFDDFLSGSGIFWGNHTFTIENLLYPIVIDWRENTGNADIAFYWMSSSQSLSKVTSEYLFSSATDIKSSPFTVTAT